jgi:hypothetical protein
MVFLGGNLNLMVFYFLHWQDARHFLQALGGQTDPTPGVHPCYINIIVLHILDDSVDMNSVPDDEPRGEILEEMDYTVEEE